MPSTHGLKKGGTWPIYWPFKATKFDWNVQALTFSEWNTWSVKALMELMAASFFGATSPATLPKQKPWSWRCTGCMNWYKGWRVRTRMSLEINLFIKNQWQDLIAVTCVLIRKRYRQEKKMVVFKLADRMRSIRTTGASKNRDYSPSSSSSSSSSI